MQTAPVVVEKSAEHRFEWSDEHGLQAREPLTLKVNVVEEHRAARRWLVAMSRSRSCWKARR